MILGKYKRWGHKDLLVTNKDGAEIDIDLTYLHPVAASELNSGDLIGISLHRDLRDDITVLVKGTIHKFSLNNNTLEIRMKDRDTLDGQRRKFECVLWEYLLDDEFNPQYGEQVEVRIRKII